MPIGNDLAAYFSRWDLTGDLDILTRGIGQMFVEVEAYAEDIDEGGQLWTPLGYTESVVADRPIGWWRLGETSGSDVIDAVADRHPGSYNGTFTLNQRNAIAEPGASVLLDGSSGYVIVPDGDDTLGTPQFTIEAWIFPTAVQDGVITQIHGGSPTGFILSNLSGDLQGELFNGSGGSAITAAGAVALNAWTHVALTYDGATATVYANGAVVASMPFTGYSPATASAVQIGSDALSTWFKGDVQEVALYDHALTSAAVVAHYAARSGSSGRFVPVGAQVGWQPLWDYKIALHNALPWLAMIMGETAPQGATDDQLRSLIVAAPNQDRGTPRAIADAVKQTLTGGQLIGIKERWRSDTLAVDEDAMSIFTYLTQTPDQNAAQAALRRTVPADIDIYYSVLTGPTWDALETAAGGGTWDALYSHFGGGTWSAIESATLALPGYVLY